MLWDARPGIVTDPMRVTVADDGEEGIEMSLLPEGWSLEERVGHRSLSFAGGGYVFGRFGESLLYETGDTEVSWWVLVSRNHIVILHQTTCSACRLHRS